MINLLMDATFIGRDGDRKMQNERSELETKKH